MLTPTGLGPRKVGGINAVRLISEASEEAGRQSLVFQTKRTFTSSQRAIRMDESTTLTALLRLHRRRGRRNPDNRHQDEVNVREYSCNPSQ